MVKRNETTKYSVDVKIDWNDLNRIWIDSQKIKGIKTWFRYIINYGKYSQLANFGAKVINEYHIPFREIKPLYKDDKK